MIDLRAATMQDSDRLFAWRNDPVTLACSKSTAPVPRSDHNQWMTLNVLYGYPEHIVLMAQDQDVAVGVVRFDALKSDVMQYKASLTIAPQHRGSGYSYPVLAEACSYMTDFTIHADIRKDNTASRKTFERCGFRETGSDHDFVFYRKPPQ